MNKIGWEKLRKIVEWFYEIQQQGNQTFQVCDIRTAFKLTVPSTYTRLKRFIALGIIKPVSLGCYEISQLSPEKIQEIKQKYIPPGSLYEIYYYKGKRRTVKEIYEKYKPPMKLQYFVQRIRRGWSVQKAIETPLRKWPANKVNN